MICFTYLRIAEGLPSWRGIEPNLYQYCTDPGCRWISGRVGLFCRDCASRRVRVSPTRWRFSKQKDLV